MNPRCIENDNQNMMTQPATNGCMHPPVYECPDERICERYIIHEVPHIVPIHTKMINHHVYRHSYTPCYTMSECDTCENIYEPMCKNF